MTETIDGLNFFIEWMLVVFWFIFLTGLTGSILAGLWRFARKKHVGQDTIFMRMLLWPVLVSFFVPVLFWYWQQKEGGKAFQYEMFRSAGLISILLSAMAVLWIIGAVRKTILTAKQLYCLHELKVDAHQYKTEVTKQELLTLVAAQKIVDALRTQMGIKRRICVLASPEIVSPMTMGYLHPCVFIPTGEIDAEALQLILVHELTHIRHRDFLMKQMMLVISSLYWFCPGVKKLFSQLNVCNEYYCDLDSIEQLGIERHAYFSQIRAFAADQKQRRAYAYSALCENKNTLKARERAVKETQLAKENNTFTTVGRITAVLLAGILLCTSVYTISFASVVGYDAAMKWITSEETERQEKQAITDASSLHFTGEQIKSEELIAKASVSKHGSDAQEWTLQKGQEIQFGPFYKEKGESIWVYTYANYKVEYGIICDTKRRCLEGKNEGHNFDIDESGLYYVFIRNWSGERTEGGSLVVQ